MTKAKAKKISDLRHAAIAVIRSLCGTEGHFDKCWPCPACSSRWAIYFYRVSGRWPAVECFSCGAVVLGGDFWPGEVRP